MMHGFIKILVVVMVISALMLAGYLLFDDNDWKTR